MPALLFVHGIRADCASTYGSRIYEFTGDYDSRFDAWYVQTLDYDWRKSIEVNSNEVAKAVEELHASSGEEIYIIAHSMGGLVARKAILNGSGWLVKRLIMLGTPNLGAISTAQLGLISQPATRLTAAFIGSYLKAPGIRDLTRVPELFAHAADQNVQTEYVTIPGTYFHENRPFWHAPGDDVARRLFGPIAIAVELLQALTPMLRIDLERPHDGIVENRSCSFYPVGPGRRTEKDASLNAAAGYSRTYVHLLPRESDELTHSEIPRDPGIVEVVKQLLLTDSLENWIGSKPNVPLKY